VEISTNLQNRNPHKPPAQPCRSLQCRPHHSCCSLQRLNLTLQCPMACPELATHTLAELCALWWLPSAAYSCGNLHTPAKPQPPQTTCPALPQPQAPPPQLHTAEAALDTAVPHGMPRVGRSYTDRCLCAVVAECCLLLCGNLHKPATPHTMGFWNTLDHGSRSRRRGGK